MPTASNTQPIHGSSNIAGAGYDKDTRTLTVQFHHGRSYDYYDVDESVYQDLLHATSAGKYFNANIKNQYRYS